MKNNTYRFFTFHLILLISIWISNCETKVPAEKITLKIATANLGVKAQKIWTSVATDFIQQNPNVTIEFLGMDDRHYESTGLASMLLYQNPDIFFEWGGFRVEKHKNNGYAADLTAELNKDGWIDNFLPAAWDGSIFNDRHYMIPIGAQISNVFWYNKKVFKDLKIQIPTTWQQFLVVCETIKKAGKIPIFIGNKDLWPGGNVMGHLVSRIVGNKVYQQALNKQQPFNQPDFLEAFEMIRVLWDKKYVNIDSNGLSSIEGDSGWIQQKGVIHPLGSWIPEVVSESNVKNFKFDFFNLPQIKGKKGNQTSIMGLNVGLMVNAKSKHFKTSIQYLRFLTSTKIAKRFESIGEFNTLKEIATQTKPNSLTHKLNQLLNKTTSVVPPPDTGFDLKVANAFYTAIAKVMGGVSTPKEALIELDRYIETLK